MKLYYFLISLLVSALAASLACAHGDPIVVEVADDQLVVSGGIVDEVGYADQLFADPGIEAALSPLGNQLFTELPGFEIHGMTTNSGLYLEVLPRPVRGASPPVDRLLWHWSQATDQVQLAPNGETLSLISQRGLGSRVVPQSGSPVPSALQVAQPLAGDIGQHKHLLLYSLTNSPPAAFGAYGFFARLTSPAYQASDPFLVVLNHGLDEVDAPTAALAINAAAAAGLPGDYNGDNVVDAADYTVWRNNLGDSNEDEIHNNGNGQDGVDPADYDWWKQHYGDSIDMPGLGGIAAAIPEPSSGIMAWVAFLFLPQRRRGMRYWSRRFQADFRPEKLGRAT